VFKKINFSIDQPIDFSRLKGDYVTSYGRSPNPVITYYTIKDVDYLNSLLPVKMPWDSKPPFSVKYVELVDERSGHLQPHVDHDISLCANYYINTNKSITHFYEKKHGAKGFAYTNRDSSNIFYFHEVDKVTDFCASDNELYLLDVSKIHSVESPNPGLRRFLSWQWKLTNFDEVVNSLDNLTE
jgi:hypothetical protein